MIIFVVVKNRFVGSQLVRCDEAAFTTMSAAKEHIEMLGNNVELPKSGGLMKYSILSLGLYDNHQEWFDNVVKTAREILKEREE